MKMGNDKSKLHVYHHKEDFLADRMVYIKQSKNHTVFNPEIALSHMHVHDFVELSLVISGSGTHHTLNGSSECRPGDVYVINAGAPHSYFRNESGEELIVKDVIFDPTDILDGELGNSEHPRYCCGLFREEPMISHVELPPDYQDEAKRIIDRIEKEQLRKNLEWQEAVKLHLLDLLIMCSRRISCASYNTYDKPIPKLRDRQIVMTVMRTVLEKYNDPELSLKRIAETVALSKPRLSIIFQQVTGMHFSNYVGKVRLEQGCRMLAETDMTNEQICYACGFRDVPSFYRFFQTHMGMTPLSYRKEQARLQKK